VSTFFVLQDTRFGDSKGVVPEILD